MYMSVRMYVKTFVSTSMALNFFLYLGEPYILGGGGGGCGEGEGSSHKESCGLYIKSHVETVLDLLRTTCSIFGGAILDGLRRLNALLSACIRV